MKDLVDSLLAQSLPPPPPPDPTFRGCKACSLKSAAPATKEERKTLLAKEMRALQGASQKKNNRP